MKRSSKGIVITILVVALIALSVYGISQRNQQMLNAVEVKTAKVEKGDIVWLFSTNGDVESKSKQDYFILTPTKVLKVFVDVGDKVKKGDKLLELETQDLSIQYKIAQKQLEMAKLQLESLKKLKERWSSQNQSSLQNSTAPIQSYSLNTLTSSQMQVASPGYSLDDQIKLQEKQVEIAQLNLQSIKQNMDKQQRYVKAQINGVVTAINAREGNVFSSVQLPAVTVEDPENLQIVLNVNQYDAINISEGQKALIRFGEKTFDGAVKMVSPAATKVITQTGAENVVKVYVDILNNDGTIKPGFNVDVDIKLGEKKNVLKVPSEAILTDKKGQSFVYIVENGVAKQRKVEVGLSSDLETEIKSGVAVGEKVILNPNSSIQNGTKVKEKGGS
ncbi:HlyD family secretion protein [Caldicellulosiruptor bescii]|uniref:Efflux transporter, RND family, MFP subunit n=2 Tax=Caldicellulosiruptor bescii TaxID=31899 RepID=B9MP92_CALBD|nr:efflux RND transporter periplasmic adaptor subunit [Caldicellulosiruptor bescii]ACM61651.1 efflux transporter, RND family, MFP subunit [Caldicellulosiruptor bescii DSM 6725]PBC88540.1 HlyD family secretion protein [Caldicellulosiruptor bescii]PBC91978.1 HlyD family secretion protein [Caldicellulosiruptor bescii]PBD02610.1 HlyD family secretion protein [Caldicellulosiruptor bescii]PBD05157.1 HlyD family secretion protein [Caldicellulosiruptor bescii]